MELYTIMNHPRQTHTMILMIDEVMRLSTRLQALFSGARGPTGLSSMEAMVLAAVVEATIPPTVPKIGRSLGHARQVVQRATNGLIEKGLISNEPNPDHKRAQLLQATAKGKAIKALADTHAISAADALLREIDTGKCKQLTNELRDLRHEIEGHLRAREANARR